MLQVIHGSRTHDITMGSPMSPGGERYSPQRSYTQSRSRSPDGRGRSYTPDRDDKVFAPAHRRKSTLCVFGVAAIILRRCPACMLTGPAGEAAGYPVGFHFRSEALVLQVSTIYVGGISFDTDERALQNYFSKFGTVTEVKVRRFESGTHRA